MLNNIYVRYVIGQVVMLLGGVIAVATGAGGWPFPPGFYVGVLIAAAGIIFSIVTVRCPHCGHSLKFRGKWPQFCPHCGKEL
ncbi:hypothetical protein [Anaerolentibacter hominis]|uniref:hypothetical protein n=1 Tax=Anaerolentibacter hominis TaxID=3079009 RepID=UPI0031B8875F